MVEAFSLMNKVISLSKGFISLRRLDTQNHWSFPFNIRTSVTTDNLAATLL